MPGPMVRPAGPFRRVLRSQWNHYRPGRLLAQGSQTRLRIHGTISLHQWRWMVVASSVTETLPGSTDVSAEHSLSDFSQTLTSVRWISTRIVIWASTEPVLCRHTAHPGHRSAPQSPPLSPPATPDCPQAATPSSCSHVDEHVALSRNRPTRLTMRPRFRPHQVRQRSRC